jgi:hypothetical protein
MFLKIVAGYTDTDDDLLYEQVAKKQKRSKVRKRSMKVMREVKTCKFSLNILTLCQVIFIIIQYLSSISRGPKRKTKSHNFFVTIPWYHTQIKSSVNDFITETCADACTGSLGFKGLNCCRKFGSRFYVFHNFRFVHSFFFPVWNSWSKMKTRMEDKGYSCDLATTRSAWR